MALSTLDQQALKALLAGNQEKTKELSNYARQVRGNTLPCPACDDTGPHDDNGENGYDRMLCCRKCGEHWDVYTEAVYW
jgi:hypothetical protein